MQNTTTTKRRIVNPDPDERLATWQQRKRLTKGKDTDTSISGFDIFGISDEELRPVSECYF
jgi:hypothetical protein